MKCCGENCDTPFCPLCGKKLRDDLPQDSLLRYVRNQRASQESNLRKLQAAAEQHKKTAEHRDSPWRFDKRIKNKEKSVQKWLRWEKWLEEATCQT